MEKEKFRSRSSLECGVKVRYLLVITLSIALFSCGGGDGGGDGVVGASVSDESSARKFAWAVQISVQEVAPPTKTSTFNNTAKTGAVSGTATLTGSTVYSYDSYNGRVTTTYNNLQINFSNYSGDSNFPGFSGTVLVTGTCTKQYGYNTTYSGSWNAEGLSLVVGSSHADIDIEWRREGLDWAAIVKSGGNTWSFSF